MTRKHLSVFVWTIYLGYIAYGLLSGFLRWELVMIGLGFVGAVNAWAFGFESFEKRFGVGEARFDSETGKPLPPYRENK